MDAMVTSMAEIGSCIALILSSLLISRASLFSVGGCYRKAGILVSR